MSLNIEFRISNNLEMHNLLSSNKYFVCYGYAKLADILKFEFYYAVNENNYAIIAYFQKILIENDIHSGYSSIYGSVIFI